jgi:hypothetical protein
MPFFYKFNFTTHVERTIKEGRKRGRGEEGR